jgi:hypothetical protein
MEDINGYAEQCKDWSEYFIAGLNSQAAQATTHDRQATAHTQPARDTRLIDYTVHAVWQTTLPVCYGARAWPQILSLREQRGETSPPHLYTPGKGGADSGAISSVPYLSYPLRRAVRDRLRVAHATCRAVASTHVIGQPPCGGLSRCASRQSAGRQYVGTRSERSALAQVITRGETPCTRR